MNKETQFNNILHTLRYNYPLYPSTFGTCCNTDCTNVARGSGECPTCCEKKMGELIHDPELASKIHQATKTTAHLISDALDKIT